MSVPLTVVWLLAAAPPVSPPVTVGADQEYSVADGIKSAPPPGVTVKPTPLQTCVVLSEMEALGLTVTVIVKVFPTQAPAAVDVGVTV